MKKFFPLLSLLLIFLNQQTGAQVTDSVFVTESIKPYLYSTLPNGIMLDSKGKEVDFTQFIKDKRSFKDKPTLFITWSNRYCPPCIRLIDSILDNNIQKRYNVVLVNKDQAKDAKEPVDDISLMRKISEARPAYSKKAISLFDNHDILNSIDQGVAPMMFWMDKDMNIAGAFLSYGITINRIEEILDKVDNKTITVSKIKFQNSNVLPASIGDAALKQTINEVNGIYTFTWDYISTNKTIYRLNFTKTPEGFFEYHKSSLNVPKVEDLYNQAEIIAGVKKMLSSLNTKDINAVKGSKGNNNWYESRLGIKNFNTAIMDDESSLLFSNSIAYPALDRSSASKKQEFHLIANALGNTLSIKPKKDEGKYSGSLTYTYTINKEVQIILKEDGSNVYFNLVADKDKDGNISPFTVKYNPLGFDVLSPQDIFIKIAKNASVNTEKTPVWLNNLQETATRGESDLYIRKTVIRDTVILQTYFTSNDAAAILYSFIRKGNNLILKDIKVNTPEGSLLGTGQNLHNKRAYVMVRDGFYALLYIYKEGVKQEEFYISEGTQYNGLLKVGNLYKGKSAYGILKQNSEVLIPVEYKEIKMENNVFLVCNQENKWGAIDINGKKVVPLMYDKIEAKGKLFRVQNGQSHPDWKFGLYTHNGREVVPIGKDFLLDFDGDDAELSYVQSDNGKYGYINREGEVVISYQYSATRPFKDGLALVKNMEGKYGYINPAGDTVIPFKFTAAGDFYQGRARVSEKKNRDGAWDTDHQIDKQGNKVK